MSSNSSSDVSDAPLLGRDGMHSSTVADSVLTSQQLLASQVESSTVHVNSMSASNNKDEVASDSYDMARLYLDSDHSGSSSYVRGVVNSLPSDVLRPTAGSPTKLSQDGDDDVDDEVAETAES